MVILLKFIGFKQINMENDQNTQAMKSFTEIKEQQAEIPRVFLAELLFNAEGWAWVTGERSFAAFFS